MLRNFMTLFIWAFSLGESIHEGHDNKFWLYCKKTWLNTLKVETGAHSELLHQGPWKASYAPDLSTVPTWRLEWDSNQRPSTPKVPNTTTEPPCPNQTKSQSNLPQTTD